jgi:hypothetical protein
MKTAFLVSLVALNATSALAHTSLVPHDHPHAASMLPDALALVLAALLVGLGFVALRNLGKE